MASERGNAFSVSRASGAQMNSRVDSGFSIVDSGDQQLDRTVFKCDCPALGTPAKRSFIFG
jgi:hypothetical protein